jgi:hypothetical protein
MVAGKDLDVNILKHLKRGKVISATRIEPPLHPEGPEKMIENFGIEPEDFEYDRFIAFTDFIKLNKSTEGIFAPWCMYKDDFLSIGGHDELFAPQSREDSDIFNRFVLNGYEVIQRWDALVYHFTSRGSRFSKHAGGDIGKNSPEWMQTNQKNMRNFIRKWGTMVRHDSLMKPIIAPKYDIGFVVDSCNYETLYELEPWCSDIYVDIPIIQGYIDEEQPNTLFDLKQRVNPMENVVTNDVVVEFDGRELTPVQFQYIAQLPDILKDSGEVGEMELGIFKITINKLKTYEMELIKCKR